MTMSLWMRHRTWLKILSISTLVLFASGSWGWADVGATSIDEIIKMNKELMGQVSELTKRVSHLEGQVKERQVPASAIPPATLGGDVVKTGEGGIYMGGFVDTSFNWNFDGTPNTPTGNSTNRAFDREDNTFDLNNAEITFMRPAPEKGGAGFKTVFMYGTDSEVADSTGFTTTDEFAIQQAFIDIKIPIGTGLSVWAGKFATLQGAEVIENHLNWNASRAFLFNLAIPFTHTGVRAIYNWLDGKLNTTVGVVNGWDNAIDYNDMKDIEFRTTWTPNDTFSIGAGGLYGADGPVAGAGTEGQKRGLLDVVATVTPFPKDLPGFKLMANYDYGFQDRPKVAGHLGNADWQGYALYAKYDVNNWLTVGTRFEQFWDDASLRTGSATRLWEMTYGADFKLTKNLLTRLEYRHDGANTSTAYVRGRQSAQNTVMSSLIYTFG